MQGDTVMSGNTALVQELEDDHTGQYLTFTLADETYAVEILRIQEIKGWEPATPIPNTPDYIRGVMNLRGTIVPVVDLRIRFGLPELEYGPTTVVVVLKIYVDDRERIMGLIVDGVADVFNIGPGELQGPPDFGTDANTRFLRGLATVEEQMVIVLDVDAVIAAEELNIGGSADES